MTYKLLVVTAGTIAAGVGQELTKQLKTNSASQLHAVVRYIDTADLEKRYPTLRAGDWYHMTIDPHFMDTVSRNPSNHPYLNGLLYPGLLPEISGSGGGSIRYNAAGAIAINRSRMKHWLTTSIADLVKSGTGQSKLAIALVVSAVGATGSGTLERLVDLVVECAQNAKIAPPVHCDVYILQPGMENVTDLGLSNTVALYAEMASARLSRIAGSNKSRRGRTILVDWGSEHRMASIEQLQKTAATLIRLTHNPATAIAAEFQDREVDNHVLREQDLQTHLPSHLSTATTVTISLGDLEEKIVQRDAVRIVDLLVFGGQLPENSGDDFIPEANRGEHKEGALLSLLNKFLQGDTPDERYEHLVTSLRENLNLTSLLMPPGRLEGMTPQDQASRLRSLWQNDNDEIAKSARKEIERQRNFLIGSTINAMIAGRRTAIATAGFSLRDLLDEYQNMEDLLSKTRSVSLGLKQGAASDSEVFKKIAALENPGWGRTRPTVAQVLNMIRSNLEQKLQRETHTSAIDTLKQLQDHCAEYRRNLQVILQKLYKQRKNNPKWAAANQDFHIEMNNLLCIAALSTPQEINRYADQVSVVPTPQKGRLPTTEEAQRSDPLARFRQWLDGERKIDVLFKGDMELLLNLALTYARDEVHEAVEDHSVVDVLMQTGGEVLKERLSAAIGKAKSLVSFSPHFATEIREARHVCAKWKSDEQQALLEKIMNQAPEQCSLLKSDDPTEIVVFYYIDGLPMSAITDLTGRCLDAFLKRRRAWYHQSQLNGNRAEANNRYNQSLGVPVYRGRDAQETVLETGVIRYLYEARGQSVEEYKPDDMPELRADTNHK